MNINIPFLVEDIIEDDLGILSLDHVSRDVLLERTNPNSLKEGDVFIAVVSPYYSIRPDNKKMYKKTRPSADPDNQLGKPRGGTAQRVGDQL